MITLKGMTWDHSRGYDPMIATSKVFAEKHNNEVSAKGLLQKFDIEKYNNELELLNKQSVGSSHQSYNIDGHQWALALDAATQVSCFRSDLIESLPKSWEELFKLSQKKRVIWPLKPVHAISSFYSIYNNITEELEPNSKNFIQRDSGIKVLQMMKQISQHLPSECFDMDPIKTAEILSRHNDFFYSPYTYGFSNYSRTGYRKNLLTYGNVIDLSGKGPHGTHLGGTGIAISNKSKNKDLALEYSYWIAGSECQQTIFYTNGGQPGNSDAWENNNINLETNNFFKNTRLTLDQAWVRPRHNGYMKFQDESGNMINEYLQSNVNEVNVIDKLKLMYAESFEE